MKPLRQKLVDTLTLRGYSARTIESYVKTVELLAKAYWRSPEKITNEEITAFLLRGLRESRWSASTLNVKVSGLRFFYHHVLGRSLKEVESAMPRTKRPKSLPRVYSREELELLFTTGCRNQKERVFLMLVYGGGLRLGEACRLKVSDIESKRMRIRVNQGKRKKDRYTLLRIHSSPGRRRPDSAFSGGRWNERGCRIAVAFIRCGIPLPRTCLKTAWRLP